jgi:hypothetical protein
MFIDKQMRMKVKRKKKMRRMKVLTKPPRLMPMGHQLYLRTRPKV